MCIRDRCYIEPPFYCDYGTNIHVGDYFYANTGLIVLDQCCLLYTSGEAFGIDLEEVDKTKLLISRINDRHIFPHIKISYMMRSVDSNAEHLSLIHI